MAKTYLSDNKISVYDCTITDIKNSIKALNLLDKEVIKIMVKGYFDFDTKYYHQYKESEINKIFRQTREEVEVTLKNNRLYHNDIILPLIDSMDYVRIYYDEA